LTLLNDPTYVECARAMAARILAQPPAADTTTSDAKRIE
jgi:hypothetical protein